jgi:hypothetical protein
VLAASEKSISVLDETCTITIEQNEEV